MRGCVLLKLYTTSLRPSHRPHPSTPLDDTGRLDRLLGGWRMADVRDTLLMAVREPRQAIAARPPRTFIVADEFYKYYFSFLLFTNYFSYFLLILAREGAILALI